MEEVKAILHSLQSAVKGQTAQEPVSANVVSTARKSGGNKAWQSKLTRLEFPKFMGRG